MILARGISRALMGLVLAAAPAMAEEALDVPSGQSVEPVDMIWNEPGDGLVYRFRFLAPAIGSDLGPDFDAVMDDMAHLCTTYAIPRLADIGPQPSQIIISLSNEPIEFGVMDPTVIQYFEAYVIENDVCIWEMF